MTLNRDGKKSRWGFLALALAAVIAHSIDCPAQDAAADANLVRLTLKVTNGTKNGKPVVADKITLTMYEHERLVDTLNAEVGPQNAVDFNGIRAGEHMVAVATAFHQGMSFSSGDIRLGSGRKQVTASVRVFDVSYDISRLSVATHHLIIKPRDADILLTEFIELVNPSDMACFHPGWLLRYDGHPARKSPDHFLVHSRHGRPCDGHYQEAFSAHRQLCAVLAGWQC
jgi:hypothetical protein